jgi:hypothetical protein
MRKQGTVDAAVCSGMCEARKAQRGPTLWIAKCSTKRLFAAWCRQTRAEGAHESPRISDFVSQLRIKIASRKPV